MRHFFRKNAAAGFLLCAALLVAATSSHSQSNSPQTPPASSASNTSSSAANDWPDGAGKDVFLRACSNCHGPDNVIGRNLNVDQWTDVINRMIQYGAQGSDDDFSGILDYLTTNFGPAPAKVNINKATPMNMRNWLGMSSKEAHAIADYRAQHGDYKSIEDLQKVPGVDADSLNAIKDKLTF